MFLNEKLEKEGDKLDKNLLYVTTGTLVLSINFFLNFEEQLSNLWLIVTAWGFLVLSLIMLLITQLIVIWSSYSQNVKATTGLLSTKSIYSMNVVMVGCFVIGLIFLVIFASINLF